MGPCQRQRPHTATRQGAAMASAKGGPAASCPSSAAWRRRRAWAVASASCGRWISGSWIFRKKSAPGHLGRLVPPLYTFCLVCMKLGGSRAHAWVAVRRRGDTSAKSSHAPSQAAACLFLPACPSWALHFSSVHCQQPPWARVRRRGGGTLGRSLCSLWAHAHAGLAVHRHPAVLHHSTPANLQVYLAKWRETTVAVKVLGALGAGTSSLDDEFPDAAAGKTHPLYESLQKVGQGPREDSGQA